MFSRGLRTIRPLLRISRCTFYSGSSMPQIQKIVDKCIDKCDSTTNNVTINEIKSELIDLKKIVRRHQVYDYVLEDDYYNSTEFRSIEEKIEYFFNRGFALIYFYGKNEFCQAFDCLKFAHECVNEYSHSLDKNKLAHYTKCIDCYKRQYELWKNNKGVEYEDLEFVDIEFFDV